MRGGNRVVPAFGRLADCQQAIVNAARGGQVDQLLWEFLFAAFLEMHVASIMDHVDRVQAITKARKASQ